MLLGIATSQQIIFQIYYGWRAKLFGLGLRQIQRNVGETPLLQPVYLYCPGNAERWWKFYGGISRSSANCSGSQHFRFRNDSTASCVEQLCATCYLSLTMSFSDHLYNFFACLTGQSRILAPCNDGKNGKYQRESFFVAAFGVY